MLCCDIKCGVHYALNALKCRSHSAEDVGITSNLLAHSNKRGYGCS